MTARPAFTIGVEEEYGIVDPASRALCGRAGQVMPLAQEDLGDKVQPELKLSQIETMIAPCTTLAAARSEIVRMRRAVIAAAQRDGRRIVAVGTHPFSHPDAQAVTPKDRYRDIMHEFQELGREMVIFGCHVHIGLDDQELRVQVMSRMRVWLAPILALAANSPFWLGHDTGYDSYLTELWGRWPLSGPPGLFASRAEYEALAHALVATGSIADATKIYWDIRLPEKVPTVEVRVADVCLSVDEAVMVAGLARGLVRTCYEQALREEPFPMARPELLRVVHWRAARHGLDAELIDVGATQARPAREVVEALLQVVRPGLEAEGEWDEVAELVHQTLARGNGATRLRAAYRRAGRLEDVVDMLVAETAAGTGLTVA